MKIIKTISNILILSVMITMIFGTTIFSSVPMANAAPAGDQKYTLLEPLPSIGNGPSTIQTEVNLKEYVVYAVNLLIALAAVAAVVMIVWGGLETMTTDSWGNKVEGKKKVWDAVIGLLMILSTYLILKTVNPRLVNIPGTLVPPVSLTAEQTSSPAETYDDYMAQSEALTQMTTEAANQIAANIQSVNAANSQLLQQRNELQASLNTLTSGLGINADTDPQVLLLRAQIQDINNQMQSNNGNRMMLEANSYFNSQLRPNVESPTSIEQLTDSQRNIDSMYDTVSSRLQQAGQYNLTELNDNRNYAEAVILLTKINSIIGSASSAYTSEGGMGTPTRTISMLDPVTGAAMRLPPREATAKIQALLTTVSNTISDLGLQGHSTALRDQLKSQYDATLRVFNNSVFKK